MGSCGLGGLDCGQAAGKVVEAHVPSLRTMMVGVCPPNAAMLSVRASEVVRKASGRGAAQRVRL
jgi:hypothetical protein